MDKDVVENLTASDLAYLQELYDNLNGSGPYPTELED
jgi:hypothetical protein